MTNLVFPEGKDFAFTIFDDTDHSDLENVPPIYDFLYDLGMLTTKSVWPVKGGPNPYIGGLTLASDQYRDWVRKLEQQGFEIAMHNTAYETSPRAQTELGFQRFREIIGHDPSCLANHADCYEGIYWGNYRLTGINELIYNLLTRFRHKNQFRGHLEGDSLFWGDLCRDHVKYVRNFVFQDINTIKACPQMPYHDESRPYVNHWFASSDGGHCPEFNRCISEENQDRLEAEKGVCIMYNPFGLRFLRG